MAVMKVEIDIITSIPQSPKDKLG